MAKYTITHSCGHEATHQIYGSNTHGERDRKVAYLESTPCDACYAKAQASKDGEVEEVEMHYSEYKNNYASCKTLPDSYNAKTKTIIVLVPVETEEQTAEETTTEAATETATETATDEEIAAEIATAIQYTIPQCRPFVAAGSAKCQESRDAFIAANPAPLTPDAQTATDNMAKTIEILKKYGR